VAQKLVFYLFVLYSLFLDNSDTTNAMLHLFASRFSSVISNYASATYKGRFRLGNF